MRHGFMDKARTETGIESLVVPDFVGHLREEDLEGMEKRDRRLMLAFSKLDQKQDWAIQQIIAIHRELAQIKADMDAYQKDSEAFKLKAKIVSSIAITFGAGVVAAAATAIVKWIFGKFLA